MISDSDAETDPAMGGMATHLNLMADAPGEYTGYAAVVIPGVNEAIDAKNTSLAGEQVQVLADALTRAAATLEGY